MQVPSLFPLLPVGMVFECDMTLSVAFRALFFSPISSLLARIQLATCKEHLWKPQPTLDPISEGRSTRRQEQGWATMLLSAPCAANCTGRFNLISVVAGLCPALA